MKRNAVILLICMFASEFALLVASSSSYSHRGEKHDATTQMEEKSAKTESPAFKQINRDLLSDIMPIFQQSCVACHGGGTQKPWYYSIPGVRNLIDSDIEEGTAHLDLSGEFPFPGHGSPVEDLESIGLSIREGSMPPLRYWILHPSSRLSEAERGTILRWVENSLVSLQSKSAGK